MGNYKNDCTNEEESKETMIGCFLLIVRLTKLLSFISLCGLLIYMGHNPFEWEFWAVVVCCSVIEITEYIEK